MTLATTSERLTDDERSRLGDEEAAIEAGARQVGAALAAIRDQRLYRETHATFEDYCRKRWGIGRSYANKQITAAKVTDALGTNVPKINEAQARELAPLLGDPDAVRDTWKRANEATNGEPTAAAIRTARDFMTPVRTDSDDTEDDKPQPTPTPPKSKRRPLPDQFFNASHDLTKTTERVKRLADDDRFPRNAEQLAAKHRSELLKAIDVLTDVVERMPS